MAKTWQDRGFDFLNNVWAGAALMILCSVAAALYTHYGQEWERPVVNGLITGAVVMSLYMSLRALMSLPLATAKATPENIGAKVLGWLHKFGLTITTCPDKDGFGFYYVVQTPGRKVLVINRNEKILPDYLNVTGLITLTDEDKAFLAVMSDDEKFDALFDIQKELWRGPFGFDFQDLETKGMLIFLRIPITPDITEVEVLDAVWRMEAILGAIRAINGRLGYYANKKKREAKSEDGVQEGTGSAKELRGDNAEAIPRS